MVCAETSDLNALFGNASDESRALIGSHVLAALLALTWLALVQFLPRPLVPPLGVDERVIVTVVPPTFEIAPLATSVFTRERATGAGDSRSASRIERAFTGGAGMIDRGDLVRGIKVTSSAAAPLGSSPARTVPLATQPGSGTPGIARIDGAGLARTGLGAVAGEQVPRATVAIRPPEVQPVTAGAASGDAREVGESARAHAPQLERCYQEEGLTRNPALAGLVRLVIEVDAGRVTSARVVDRSWTGAGVAETESCLIRTVRGWRLGTSTARLTLPFSFTSGGAR